MRAESDARASAADGGEGSRCMLVVSEILPGGPAEVAGLQPGDVLLRVDSELCSFFPQLEAALDDAVGKSVDLEVCRGGRVVRSSVRVDDLHALTPSKLVEVSSE